MSILHSTHPVKIRAYLELLELGKHSVRVPYIWHFVIVFTALFYIALNVDYIFTCPCTILIAVSNAIAFPGAPPFLGHPGGWTLIFLKGS